jgi:DNA-directed RNA polymerase subunit alpha
LDVKGEGEVVAGDIMTSSEFEIVNPELYLATMDNNDSKLSVEFNVEQGVGYIPADRLAQENLGIGFLPVDSIFSPVKKVNYAVEDYRIGNITNLERLKLEVWTDGSTMPSDAVKSSADILMDKFFQFVNLEEKVTAAETPESSGVSAEIYNTVVESLDLSSRTFNCLKRSNLNRVGDILEFPLGPEMLKLKNFGQKSLDELTEKLAPFMKQFEEDNKS